MMLFNRTAGSSLTASNLSRFSTNPAQNEAIVKQLDHDPVGLPGQMLNFVYWHAVVSIICFAILLAAGYDKSLLGWISHLTKYVGLNEKATLVLVCANALIFMGISAVKAACGVGAFCRLYLPIKYQSSVDLELRALRKENKALNEEMTKRGVQRQFVGVDYLYARAYKSR